MSRLVVLVWNGFLAGSRTSATAALQADGSAAVACHGRLDACLDRRAVLDGISKLGCSCQVSCAIDAVCSAASDPHLAYCVPWPMPCSATFANFNALSARIIERISMHAD